MAGGGYLGMGRKFLEQGNVTCQPAAGKCSFEQVVAQDAVFRYASCQYDLKGIHVIDTLAGERSFSEEVLIDIRKCGCIRVNPAWPGKNAVKERAVAPGWK